VQYRSVFKKWDRPPSYRAKSAGEASPAMVAALSAIESDQYSTTMMIVTTMMAAISESARSIFERCAVVVASSGAMI
jgi:hypothetical protein